MSACVCVSREHQTSFSSKMWAIADSLSSSVRICVLTRFIENNSMSPFVLLQRFLGRIREGLTGWNERQHHDVAGVCFSVPEHGVGAMEPV
jgi:hypothetical protein